MSSTFLSVDDDKLAGHVAEELGWFSDEDDPQAGPEAFKYRPCQLMTALQVSRKLGYSGNLGGIGLVHSSTVDQHWAKAANSTGPVKF